jgi:hypothetical protein
MSGQRELHCKKEKPVRRRLLVDAVARLPVEVCVYTRSWRQQDELARQDCMEVLVGELLVRQAQRLVIDTRNERDVHDGRTLRGVLGPHPSGSRLVYEHVDSTCEPLLWIADIAAWCFGAGAEWRKRIDPIVSSVVDLDCQ